MDRSFDDQVLFEILIEMFNSVLFGQNYVTRQCDVLVIEEGNFISTDYEIAGKLQAA